jgi:hypothetical protein
MKRSDILIKYITDCVMMKKRITLAFCILMFVFLAGGCIDELVPVDQQTSMGDVSVYEFEAFTNYSFIDEEFIPTSTFYLTGEGVTKVVYMVENESVIDIIPLEDLRSSNEDPVNNIVVLGGYSSNLEASVTTFMNLSSSVEPAFINYTLSEDVIRGQKHIYITFSEPITGFVAFTMTTPRGQDFLHITTPPSVVRFVLPEGYTTGNPLIGKTTPGPDDTYYDSSGRKNLVWVNQGTATGSITERLQIFSNNTISQVNQAPRAISIKYYSESAPLGLMAAGGVLGLAAFLVLSRSRRERKRLARIRESVEERFPNKDKNKKGKN